MQALQGIKKDDTATQVYYTAAPVFQAREMLREDSSLKWVNILDAKTHKIVDRIYQSAEMLVSIR